MLKPNMAISENNNNNNNNNSSKSGDFGAFCT
jgi:hypothetical protein